MSKMKKVISLVLCIAMLAGTFTCLGGLVANAEDAVVTAGTTNVAKYADLDAEYDNFVYVGIDVIEVANGQLTDGFVNAGDWLEYRATILSDMYVGSCNPHIVYERDFFDVRVITSTTPSTSETFGKADYEGNIKLEDGTLMNANHPVAPQNGEIASWNTLTAISYESVKTQMGFCGIDAATYENWDFVKSNLGVTTTVTNTNFEMKTDEWITAWYVRVKEGLADGETGKSFSPAEIWKHQLGIKGTPGDSRRLGDIYTADTLGTYASAKSLSLRMSVVEHVFLDDCEHTFTIGEGATATFMVDGAVYGTFKGLVDSSIAAPEANPAKDGYEFKGWALDGTTDILTFPQTMGNANVTYVAIFEKVGGEGGEDPDPDEPVVPDVKTYTVKFVDLKGTELDSKAYKEGDAIVIPEIENYLGCVGSNGKLIEVAATMGTSDLTYTVVYTTDKFDVKVNLDGGTYAAAPEGATVEDGTLIIKVALGTEVDLAAMPLPEKEGHTGAWSAAKVKVESINGATAKVNWTPNTYTATFYLDKEAYEAGAEALTTVEFKYDKVVAFGKADAALKNLKPEKKHVGWKNAATGETVEKTTKFNSNVILYADWTDYDCTVTVWGRDYANGGWKALTTYYRDVDSTIKLNDLKAFVNEENYGTTAAEYVVAGSASTFSNETAIRADFKTVKGHKDVYLFTKTNFDVTFKTPVFNADGYITEEFTSETKKVASLTDDTFLTASIIADTPAAYTGYKFIGWEDAKGEIYAPGTIALNYANGTDNEFTAKYELVEYTIEFAIDNTSAKKEIFTAEGTYKLGDKFTLSEVAVVKADGTKGILPVIGVENGEQEGGRYRNVDGYKFTGWKVGTQTASLVDYDITQEVELTPAVIKSVTFNETIQIKGFWEALSYDFVAYIAKSYDAEGKPVYEALPAVSVKTGASLTEVYAAATETAKANLPKGYRFSVWRNEVGSVAPNTMAAYGTEVYAAYAAESLSIYIDYNYGTEDAPVALEETMSKSNQYGSLLFYGVDVVNDIPEGETISIDKMIRTSTVSEAVSPGVTYEVVDWKVYYVVDENDVYNPEKWVEGYSDVENSTVAKYTLIYQVEWMAHKDFFFRVYNTDGALRSALDWKFNKYFWYMDKPTDEEGAIPLNTLPDRLIILGFIPKFEFEGGFAIRVEPLTLSKAWLDPANWGSLLEALWNGITSGFGGAI